MFAEAGGKEDRHVKLLIELDLTKPLLQGSKLKYKNCKTWVEFKHEMLPLFCFYYGTIGHNEKLCIKRKKDVSCNKGLKDQF